MTVRRPKLPPGGYVGARSNNPEDWDKLSMKPSQIRNRLRRAAKRAKRTGDDTILRWELQKYQDAGMIKPVEEWDLEELAHGRPRNKSGNFKGITPSWITIDVQREAKRRLHNKAFGAMAAHVDLAVRTLHMLLTSEELDEKGKRIVDARTKLAAAQFIIEHVVGKPASILESEATDKIRQVFAAAIVLDDGKPQDHLSLSTGEAIDGEVVEDDEDTE